MQDSEQAILPWQERCWNFGSISNAVAGKRYAGVVEQGTYADGTPLQNPLHIIIGATEGPTLYVQAAVHGDEVNGVEALRRVVTGIDPQEMSGILLVVPVTNIPGFLMRQRLNPFDKEDMNRVWP